MKKDQIAIVPQLKKNVGISVVGSVVGEKSSELGVVKIHDNVLASLVSRAVLGVEGVTRLAGSALIDTIAGIAGSHSRAISIQKGEDDPEKMIIEVKVNLAFGTRVPAVAPLIQRAVIEQVEEATGINVSGVNVLVQQMEDPKTVADKDAADDSELPLAPL